MKIQQSVRPIGYISRKPSVKEAIRAKMKVLREFCIVDNRNENDIRAQLQKAIEEQPYSDYEIVLDRVAQTMIKENLKT